MKRCLISIIFIFATACMVNAQTVDFEDLSLSTESFWNGSDESGGFVSGGVAFSSYYDTSSGFVYSDGFAYSNITDTNAEGYTAAYNAITGSGVDGSEIYAVAYDGSDGYYQTAPPTITLKTEQVITGAYFTNNNYAFYSMTKGDGLAKKFTEDDWFKLTITGIDAAGTETGTVDFKLADGTDIVDNWTWVDLSDLGPVKQLTFSMSSTDNGDFGMNTPAYFAMDNFNDKDDSDDSIDKKDSSDDSTCFIQSIIYEK